MLWSATARLSANPSPLHLPVFNQSITVFGKSKPSRVCCSPSRAMETNDDTSKAKGLSFDDFLSKKPYSPPTWASHLKPIPSHVFSLAHLPTPIHKWNLPNLPQNTEVWLKRDDLSGMQLSGNKVRKLEFLLAEAVAQGADCIITIGGIQSNHCRATAVAAKYLNLDSYLILRTSKLLVDKDPGLTGNLLVERFMGTHIQLISKEEYAKIGSVALTNVLKEQLLKEGRRPYVIPVGGSNSLGTWGYIEAMREIEEQLQIRSNRVKFDDIVVACGSGGTIAGLSLGSWLGALKAKVHAFCVCDDPDYFYDFVQDLIDGLQAGVNARDIVSIINAKGLGYAINTSEELKFVKEVATATGVVLDPVYSGKAAYGMMKDMAENPSRWEGRKVLFVHTGGFLGLFDKVDQMAPLVGNWQRMDVNESIPRKEGIGKMF
ncbi:hypothetical protein ERO13_D11G001200v2 [Gossypium hirsutum]|uniref:Bifunctional D-cysteine desulfhydrase/1-aminocyclopropane-1-carboxylate deaminase, mitochondrial n=1 Tax=Gossypium hirsutum TaxID=3635 RepID=A0ABM3B2M5_GOSHI|nr:bifunctional D-cysteine desulfhydrase/1-aminocyclopropane-1-carboxylate deaminase, mitochondrial [Gossypium hirsutum]KAG4118217.1 hypothetical protein ERO13_D11G001200v2 [Gossypium hirsutum]